MADQLAVWLGDQRVGTLSRSRRATMRFTPESGAPVISAGVREADGWTPGRATAWFEGLLPEGEMRTRIAARFGLSEIDSFGLLEAIGWECAGAVSVLPEDRSPARGTYRSLTDRDVGARLDALPGRPYDDDAAIRASLGGVQSKLVLASSDESWREPIDGAPSTHILKPEPEVWPGVAAAEAWAMKVAAAVTETAAADLRVDLGSRPVVIITRFDRRATKPIERIHQEDLCQVLGLPPSAKYAEPPPKDWKPSWSRLASILVARAPDPPVELDRLLRQVVVNVAIGNADAHGKNVGLLHVGEGLVSLTPMYDVVPTLAFVPRQALAAMPVGGRYRLTEIGLEQVLAEARTWGIPERIARRTIDDAVAAVKVGVDLADTTMPEVRDELRSIVVAGIERFTASETRHRLG